MKEWLSTGNLALDRLTGGGWPVGRLSELAAWEGVGKSTLLDQSIAMAQRGGAIVALIETERARDLDYSRRLGVVAEDLIVAEAGTLEEIFNKTDHILDVHEAKAKALRATKRQVPPLFLVCDSLGGTPSAEELKGDAEDKHVGVAARVIRQSFRRLVQRIADARCAFVFSNHLYQTIGQGGRLVSSGGGGVRYYPSLRVWLSKKEQLKVGNDVVGQMVEAKLKKTRLTAPRPPAELALLYGAGFDNAWTLYDWARERKQITMNGSWSVFQREGMADPIRFQRSFLEFGQLLASNPDLYRTIVEEYRSGT